MPYRPVKNVEEVESVELKVEDVPRVVEIPERTGVVATATATGTVKTAVGTPDDAHAHTTVTVSGGHTTAPDVIAPADGEVKVATGAGTTMVVTAHGDDHDHDHAEAHHTVAVTGTSAAERIVVKVEPEAVAGDEAAAAEQPDMDDVYAFFPQKDYLPDADGDQLLQIEV